jgi:phosphoglycerol transferase
MFQHENNYKTGWFDSPTMDSLVLSTEIFWLFVITQILFIVFFSFQPSLALKKYFWAILLGLIVMVNLNLTIDQHKSGTKLYFDSAGIIVSNTIPKENLNDLVIVGHDIGGMLRASFQFTQSVPALELLQPEEVFDFAVMGPSKEFALVLGNHKWTNAELLLSMGDNAVLVRKKFSPNRVIDFSRNSKSEYLAEGKNFTRPNEDAEGIWTVGQESQICLQSEVSQDYVINLYAKGFGPNVSQTGVIIINGVESKFPLTSALTAYAFKNLSNAPVRCLEFRAPLPASPKSLGLSGEERMIGILVSKLFFTKH